MRRACRPVMFLALALALICCGRRPSDKLAVATTIPDLADWVRNVGGDRVEVKSLLSGSEDPHTYEPKPTDVQALARARVLVRVGLGLEEWLEGVVQNAGNRNLRVVTVAGEIDKVLAGETHTGHSHAEGNPHVWLDPAVAKAAAGLIAGALGSADTAGRAHYEQGAAAYSRQLDSATAALVGAAQPVAGRGFLSVHETWPYFCRGFGFRAAGAVEPLPGQEPSARYLGELATRMKRESVRVIVVEPQQNRDVADALAREAGASVVVLSSVTGGLPETDTYLKLLDYDVRALAAALSQ